MIVFWLSFLFLSPFTSAESLDAVRKNNEGVEQLKEENNYMAQKSFLEGLTTDPFNPAIRLNLGLSYEIEDGEEPSQRALKEYMSALRVLKEPSPARFAALFNAARVMGNMGAIDQALEYYQKALEIEPESKEVKTNIELLLADSQGKGKGKGKSKNKQDDPKEGQGEGEQQNENQEPQPNDGQPQNRKQQKKEFKSKELSKNDVRKILEELKNQEQKIRAKEYNKGRKERPRGKDW